MRKRSNPHEHIVGDITDLDPGLNEGRDQVELDDVSDSRSEKKKRGKDKKLVSKLQKRPQASKSSFGKKDKEKDKEEKNLKEKCHREHREKPTLSDSEPHIKNKFLTMDAPVRPGLSSEAKMVAKIREKKPATWSPSTEEAQTKESKPKKSSRRAPNLNPNATEFDIEWIGIVKRLVLPLQPIPFRELQKEVAQKFKIDLGFVSAICMELTMECLSNGSVVLITEDNLESLYRELTHVHIAMVDTF